MAASRSPESPIRMNCLDGNSQRMVSMVLTLKLERSLPTSGRKYRGARGKPSSLRKSRRGSSNSGGLLDTKWKLMPGTCRAQAWNNVAIPLTALNSSKKVFLTIWSFPRNTSVILMVSSTSEMQLRPLSTSKRADACTSVAPGKPHRSSRGTSPAPGLPAPAPVPAAASSDAASGAGMVSSARTRPRLSVAWGKGRQSPWPPTRASSWWPDSPPRKAMLRNMRRPRSS
mmetsp:Transcript_130965/g.280096  ORF Transcript_130965/g.280096 Transcript_130965/m.280096 type:complete len:228 (+) Transcript_130965:314-997(+)